MASEQTLPKTPESTPPTAPKASNSAAETQAEEPTTAKPDYTGIPAEADVTVAVDEDEADSALGANDDWHSDTTSLASAYMKGRMENGRTYQVMRDGDYWGPSDEKQFNTMELGHILCCILDHEEPNQLFYAPVGENPQNILDVGTGGGDWAIDVADNYPSANVVGVDLFPPPAPWVPSNCKFEVNDVTRSWTFQQKFDLIHMRLIYGAFTPEETDAVYQSVMENLEPGGWIEQVEFDVRVMCDDDSIPEGSALAHWGPNFLGCAERAGRPLDTQLTMKASIEKAGFINVHEKVYKCPLGPWPKDKTLKDAGRVDLEHWMSGLEGWAMWLLTRYGAPQPWTPAEVHVYVANMRSALLDNKVHSWHWARRVWAQKPKE